MICLSGLASAVAQPLYRGLGLEIGPGVEWNDFPVITRVVPDSAAERLGLKAGGALLAIDAIGARSLPIEKLREELRSTPLGASLEITVGPEPVTKVRLRAGQTRGRALEGVVTEGEGVLLGADGGIYRGRFQGGVLTGFGRVDFSADDWYEGEFEAGRFSGKGVRRSRTGTFTGEWRDGSPAPGYGRRESPEGERFDGTGVWGDPLAVRGLYVFPAQRYEIEGEFKGSADIWGAAGNVRIRNLDTGHCYEGPFLRGEPKGPGTLEPREGAAVPFAPASFNQVRRVLAARDAVVASKPAARSRETLGLERPDATAGAPAGSRRAPPAATTAGPAPRPCASCAGTGCVLERCGHCAGRGVVEQAFTRYHRQEGNAYQKSHYDAVGRLAGQATVRPVTTTTSTVTVTKPCPACEGKGGRLSTKTCLPCRGRGVAAP
ncbi:MAG: hypothetical protein JNL92_24810 [Opitutaceae bacterium]|nr:hypothetical protein [Opitutaceae bacterium]